MLAIITALVERKSDITLKLHVCGCIASRLTSFIRFLWGGCHSELNSKVL